MMSLKIDRFIRIAMLCTVLALSSLAGAQSRGLPDFVELAEKQSPSVVNISTLQNGKAKQANGIPVDPSDPAYEIFRRFFPQAPGGAQPPPENRSLGSGFIISADGFVMTNAHVIEGADEVTVKLLDKREFRAKVVGADKRTDVALLKIDTAGLPAVRLGDSSMLKPGEWVVAIGSPFGFEHSVTAGIVSAKGRALPQENYVPFIQTDVAINPGNSGGPLFNLRGEVVGINSQIFSRSGGFMGISFAIPIDLAMDIQQQLRTRGRASHGRMGVSIQEVTRDMAEAFGLPKSGGALVNSVEPNGPAARAGIEPGDVILRFDGKAITASSDLPRMVGPLKPGTKVQADVWRKGQMRSVTVTIGEFQDERMASNKPAVRGVGEATNSRLGIAVSDLTPEQKQQMRLNAGILVVDIRPGSRMDLRAGDIILAVTARGDTQDIRTVQQFNQLIAQLDGKTPATLLIRRSNVQIFVPIPFAAPTPR
ncbi:MAG: DegQ family serine endoprotease [Fluviibacter sp.]